MGKKRGPTNTKRQRERARQERKEKKAQRRIQRQSDREAGISGNEEVTEVPPPEVAEAV